MSRRRPRLSFLALAAGVALSACAEDTRPNVLVITVDTLRADHLGTYGYWRPTSPCLDAFAETATVFEDAQGSSSWTLPGLASLFTSFYSSTHGCWNFRTRLDTSFWTLAEYLGAAGYDTAAVVSHVFLGSDYGLQQGFVHFDDDLLYATEDVHRIVSSPIVTEKGVAFLESKAPLRSEGPWLLWLHYFDPHAEYRAHEEYADLFGTGTDRDLYDGEIAFTDAHIGRVLDALQRLDLARHTVVVFTADHGEELGDHGGWRHGHTLFAELVRVPLFVRAPGFAPRRSRGVVRTIDVLPTLLELTGVEPPDGLQGRSLVPLLAGEDDGERAATAELRLKAGRHFDGLVTDHWKLLVDADSAQARLFDLSADPRETRDVAAEHPEVVGAMRARLEREIERARSDAAAFGHATSPPLLPGQERDLGDLGYAEAGS